MAASASYNNNLHKNATVKTYVYARNLRKETTEAEQLLWEQLRNRKLKNLKFRRQHALDKWVADFYCHEKRLVIELDGSVHDGLEAKEKDEGRSYELNQLGLTVIRFKNDDVLTDINNVLRQIMEAAEKL